MKPTGTAKKKRPLEVSQNFIKNDYKRGYTQRKKPGTTQSIKGWSNDKYKRARFHKEQQAKQGQGGTPYGDSTIIATTSNPLDEEELYEAATASMHSSSTRSILSHRRRDGDDGDTGDAGDGMDPGEYYEAMTINESMLRQSTSLMAASYDHGGRSGMNTIYSTMSMNSMTYTSAITPMVSSLQMSDVLNDEQQQHLQPWQHRVRDVEARVFRHSVALPPDRRMATASTPESSVGGHIPMDNDNGETNTTGGSNHMHDDPHSTTTTMSNDKLQQLLQVHYNYTSFRPGQLEPIQNILGGHSTLCVLSTGSGKSLCYQLPAMILPGLCLVVTPLLSLMYDQCQQLPKSLPGRVWSNTSTYDEISETLRLIYNGILKVLYISPERLLSPLFHRQLLLHLPQTATSTGLSFVCIDEVHCLSEWSHGFRPSYLGLQQVVQQVLHAPPILGLTATATRESVRDLQQLLHISPQHTVIHPSIRHNLFLSVLHVTNATHFPTLLSLLQSRLFKTIDQRDGIIVYVSTQYTAESIARNLRTNGMNARHYHAGMAWDEREKTQRQFLNNSIQIIVATIAFGLGINKPNIRAVIHYNIPRSVENYIQEVGRGGRDGYHCYCVLFYNDHDAQLVNTYSHGNLVDQSQIDAILADIVRRIYEGYMYVSGAKSIYGGHPDDRRRSRQILDKKDDRRNTYDDDGSDSDSNDNSNTYVTSSRRSRSTHSTTTTTQTKPSLQSGEYNAYQQELFHSVLQPLLPHIRKGKKRVATAAPTGVAATTTSIRYGSRTINDRDDDEDSGGDGDGDGDSVANGTNNAMPSVPSHALPLVLSSPVEMGCASSSSNDNDDGNDSNSYSKNPSCNKISLRQCMVSLPSSSSSSPKDGPTSHHQITYVPLPRETVTSSTTFPGSVNTHDLLRVYAGLRASAAAVLPPPYATYIIIPSNAYVDLDVKATMVDTVLTTLQLVDDDLRRQGNGSGSGSGAGGCRHFHDHNQHNHHNNHPPTQTTHFDVIFNVHMTAKIGFLVPPVDLAQEHAIIREILMQSGALPYTVPLTHGNSIDHHMMTNTSSTAGRQEHFSLHPTHQHQHQHQHHVPIDASLFIPTTNGSYKLILALASTRLQLHPHYIAFLLAQLVDRRQIRVEWDAPATCLRVNQLPHCLLCMSQCVAHRLVTQTICVEKKTETLLKLLRLVVVKPPSPPPPNGKHIDIPTATPSVSNPSPVLHTTATEATEAQDPVLLAESCLIHPLPNMAQWGVKDCLEQLYAEHKRWVVENPGMKNTLPPAKATRNSGVGDDDGRDNRGGNQRDMRGSTTQQDVPVLMPYSRLKMLRTMPIPPADTNPTEKGDTPMLTMHHNTSRNISHDTTSHDREDDEEKLTFIISDDDESHNGDVFDSSDEEELDIADSDDHGDYAGDELDIPDSEAEDLASQDKNGRNTSDADDHIRATTPAPHPLHPPSPLEVLRAFTHAYFTTNSPSELIRLLDECTADLVALRSSRGHGEDATTTTTTHTAASIMSRLLLRNPTSDTKTTTDEHDAGRGDQTPPITTATTTAHRAVLSPLIYPPKIAQLYSTFCIYIRQMILPRVVQAYPSMDHLFPFWDQLVVVLDQYWNQYHHHQTRCHSSSTDGGDGHDRHDGNDGVHLTNTHSSRHSSTHPLSPHVVLRRSTEREAMPSASPTSVLPAMMPVGPTAYTHQYQLLPPSLVTSIVLYVIEALCWRLWDVDMYAAGDAVKAVLSGGGCGHKQQQQQQQQQQTSNTSALDSVRDLIHTLSDLASFIPHNTTTTSGGSPQPPPLPPHYHHQQGSTIGAGTGVPSLASYTLQQQEKILNAMTPFEQTLYLHEQTQQQHTAFQPISVLFLLKLAHGTPTHSVTKAQYQHRAQHGMVWGRFRHVLPSTIRLLAERALVYTIGQFYIDSILARVASPHGIDSRDGHDGQNHSQKLFPLVHAVKEEQDVAANTSCDDYNYDNNDNCTNTLKSTSITCIAPPPPPQDDLPFGGLAFDDLFGLNSDDDDDDDANEHCIKHE